MPEGAPHYKLAWQDVGKSWLHTQQSTAQHNYSTACHSAAQRRAGRVVRLLTDVYVDESVAVAPADTDIKRLQDSSSSKGTHSTPQAAAAASQLGVEECAGAGAASPPPPKNHLPTS